MSYFQVSFKYFNFVNATYIVFVSFLFLQFRTLYLCEDLCVYVCVRVCVRVRVCGIEQNHERSIDVINNK